MDKTMKEAEGKTLRLVGTQSALVRAVSATPTGPTLVTLPRSISSAALAAPEPEAKPEPEPEPRLHSDSDFDVGSDLEPLVVPRTAFAAGLNRLIVTVYRLVGFGVLTVIVVALLAFLGGRLFYWVNTGWVTPTVVSPTDERVLSLEGHLTELKSTRDRLVGERGDDERRAAMHSHFAQQLRRALASDAVIRRQELDGLRGLVRRYHEAAAAEGPDQAVAAARARLDKDLEAHLIDRDRALAGGYQLSQMERGDLSLADRAHELGARADQLENEGRSFAAALGHGGGALSIELARVRAEIDRAEIEAQQARESRAQLDVAVQRYERLIEMVSASPVLRAAERRADVAFAPYANLAHAQQGAAVYRCLIGPLLCREIGRVVELLPGEVVGSHPTESGALRGQMVRIDLADAPAAQEHVLFVERKPFGI